LCCKSLFALVIKNSPGCRRDFRVKMWGTSSPTDKLTGDLGNVIEAAQIGVRRSDRLTAGKSSPGNFGLLQHGIIPGSCHMKAQGISSPATHERSRSVGAYVGLTTRRHASGAIDWTGRTSKCVVTPCPAVSFRSGRRAADPRAKVVSAKGLGDEACQAKGAPQGHSRRRAQARGHSAPHVDRPNRAGRRRRPPRNEQTRSQSSRSTAGKMSCRDDGGGEIAIFCELSIRKTALATLIHQRRPTPSCGGQAPTAERTVGPARTIAESLTSKPGIREHYRHITTCFVTARRRVARTVVPALQNVKNQHFSAKTCFVQRSPG